MRNTGLLLLAAAIFLLFLSGCAFIEQEKGKLSQKEKELFSINQGKTKSPAQISGAAEDKSNGVALSSGEQQPCTIPKTMPLFSHNKYYTGPLIDSHVHMPVSSKIVSTFAIQSGFKVLPAYDDKLSIDYITCLFDSEGIIQTFGFHLVPNMAIGASLDTVRLLQEKYGVKYAHFYMPTPLGALNPSPEKVDEILTGNPFFKGYGEVKFDFSEIKNKGIEDPEYLKAYALAEKYGLVIMMHPAPSQKEAVIRLLKKYPNVNFLFHGSNELKSWMDELLSIYKNAHYSLDANLVDLYGWEPKHFNEGVAKQEFMAYMDSNFDKKLQEDVLQWKSFIEKHPDQMTWGTDRWYKWHFDEDVGALLEEFGRAFIAELDPSVQEKFAYKNAQKLMEG